MTTESETSTDTATKVGKVDWLTGHIAYISGLKNPSEPQQLLVLLHNKADKSKDDLKKLNLIVKAERSLEETKRSRAAVLSMISADKNEAAEAERKARTHKLIQLGTLVKLAGLEQFNRAEIFGILLAAFPNTDADVEKIKRAGQSASSILAKREEKSAAETQAAVVVPTPTAATAPAAVDAPAAVPAPTEPEADDGISYLLKGGARPVDEVEQLSMQAAEAAARKSAEKVAAAKSFKADEKIRIDSQKIVSNEPTFFRGPEGSYEEIKDLNGRLGKNGARWIRASGGTAGGWEIPAGADLTPFGVWLDIAGVKY